MSNPRPTAERIDLFGSEDPRDVIHRAVACLARGGIVALPTETAYSLAVSALQPEAVARLRAMIARPADRPMTLGLKSAEELRDWVPDLPVERLRLVRRAWPGPVTFVVEGDVPHGLASQLPPEVRAVVAPGQTLGVRAPMHPAPRDIARLLPGPLVLTGARREGAPPVTSADALPDLEDIDMVLDDGPVDEPMPSTVVRLNAEGWSIARAGAIEAAELARLAATILLFVCTGNTCRSPMAEALCKAMLAERLGCGIEELEERGFVVLSAGVGAHDGMPAAKNAIEVVRAWGGSLDEHASRKVTQDLLDIADWIIGMTADHLDAVQAHMPDVAPKCRLLHPEGRDVPDPIGSDKANYRKVAEAIRGYLAPLLDEIGVR